MGVEPGVFRCKTGVSTKYWCPKRLRKLDFHPNLPFQVKELSLTGKSLLELINAGLGDEIMQAK